MGLGTWPLGSRLAVERDPDLGLRLTVEHDPDLGSLLIVERDSNLGLRFTAAAWS